MTEDQMLQHLQAACDKAGSITRWARQHHLSPSYVGDMLARRRTIGPKVLAALGYQQDPPTYSRVNK